MAVVSVKQALAGKVAAGSEVTVRGWVRTRRDSKAGLSLRRTSTTARCFDPIQVVAPTTLPNYETEVMHLTAGCAVDRRRRRWSQSQGKGQAVEIQADERRGRRLGRRPRDLPDPAQAAHVRVPARGRPPAPAHQHVRRRHPRAPHAGAWRSTASSTSAASSGSTRRSSRQRRRGRRRRCSASRTLDLPNLPRTPDGQGRLRQGLLRQGGLPHRVRPAQRRDLLPGAAQGLHVRPDVPRRELEHLAPPGRVLDDRAGDRLRRPRRRRRPRRGVPQVHLQGACSTSAPTT